MTVKKIQVEEKMCTKYKYQYRRQQLTSLQSYPLSINCLVCYKSCWSSTLWSKPAEEAICI